MLFKINQIAGFLIIALGNLLPPSVLEAQNHAESIKEYRKHYREKFLNGSKSLLKEDDLKYLRFYEPDSTYQVTCLLELTPILCSSGASCVTSFILYVKSPIII